MNSTIGVMHLIISIPYILHVSKRQWVMLHHGMCMLVNIWLWILQQHNKLPTGEKAVSRTVTLPRPQWQKLLSVRRWLLVMCYHLSPVNSRMRGSLKAEDVEKKLRDSWGRPPLTSVARNPTRSIATQWCVATRKLSTSHRKGLTRQRQ